MKLKITGYINNRRVDIKIDTEQTEPIPARDGFTLPWDEEIMIGRLVIDSLKKSQGIINIKDMERTE